jgi:hypothetical protein
LPDVVLLLGVVVPVELVPTITCRPLCTALVVVSRGVISVFCPSLSPVFTRATASFPLLSTYQSTPAFVRVAPVDWPPARAPLAPAPAAEVLLLR